MIKKGLLCSLVLMLFADAWVHAQCPGQAASRWPQSSVVTFALDPSFSAAEKQKIRSAFNKWNWSNSNNHSQVDFSESSSPSPDIWVTATYAGGNAAATAATEGPSTGLWLECHERPLWNP